MKKNCFLALSALALTLFVFNCDTATESDTWQKMYGGSRTGYYWHKYGEAYYYTYDRGDDFAREIVQTSDGSYIIAGSSKSADISGTTKHAGQSNFDYYIVKLDANGDL
ncbi:MAG: hypothetical protein A2176_06510 [Spirochaetes bacterium RBG_13_51_14]|nr:MAG: hypothetical protein A2176_06510 [Spirochaetes bacterium RBG_13_51_14]